MAADFNNPAQTLPVAPRSDRGNGKDEPSYGIAFITLPNGKSLEGYVVLSAKNLARMGITPEQAQAFGNARKTLSNVKLEVQFGRKDAELAESVQFDD